MQNKKAGATVYATAIIVLLFIIGLIVYINLGQRQAQSSGNLGTSESTGDLGGNIQSDAESNSQTEETQSTKTITITSSGFSPSTLEISRGDTVKFVNQNTVGHWPASAVHPTHKVYPGSDIAKCDTAEASQIFDSCRALQQGESFEFTFNEIGTWRYHDHRNPALTGTIIVR